MTPSDDPRSTGPSSVRRLGSDLSQLPPTLPALWRTVKIGYDAEPKLLFVSMAMTLFTALPDSLIALWVALIADAAGILTSIIVGYWFFQ